MSDCGDRASSLRQKKTRRVAVFCARIRSEALDSGFHGNDVPAKAYALCPRKEKPATRAGFAVFYWIPAFAGMTF